MITSVCCRRASNGPQMERRGCTATRGRTFWPTIEAAVEIGVVAGGDLQGRQLRIDEAGEERGGRGAGFSPATRASRLRFHPLQAGGRAPRRRRRAPRRSSATAARLFVRRRRATARRQPAGARRGLRAARQSSGHRRRNGASPAASLGGIRLGARQRLGDAVEAASEIDVTEGGDLERARGAAHGERVEPEAGQRMLQQRHDGGRREILGGGRDDEIEERAGRRLGERAPGAVVDADAPGFEAHGDAAGEQPVGRDQRGGSARRLRGLAQNEGDGFGFVLRRRRFDQADALQSVFDGARRRRPRCTAASDPSCRMGAWPR